MSENQQKQKPVVGVYALTSCYGCQLQVATVSRIVEVAQAVNFGSYYMLSSDSSMHSKVDVAFVEGSVSTEKDLLELKEIRKNAKILVAMGACAVNGGVQSWDNGRKSYQDLYSEVYGEGSVKVKFKGMVAKPIQDFVKVDHFLPGCPPEEHEILYFISTFLFGSWPEAKDYPVCHECRLEGNPCILIEKGEPCLGPVTTAGCGARCINFRVPCIGCRGPVPNDCAWFDSLAVTFREKGFDREYIEARFRIFGAHDRKLKELLDKVFGEKARETGKGGLQE